MSMPKGFKIHRGYATVDSDSGGLGYREIAEKMTSDGCKMNHSTARNIFISAMGKEIVKSPLLLDWSDEKLNLTLDACSETIFEMSKNPSSYSSPEAFKRKIRETLSDSLTEDQMNAVFDILNNIISEGLKEIIEDGN